MGDMRLRNVGIVGYLGVFLIVVVLLAVLFYRTQTRWPAPGRFGSAASARGGTGGCTRTQGFLGVELTLKSGRSRERGESRHGA